MLTYASPALGTLLRPMRAAASRHSNWPSVGGRMSPSWSPCSPSLASISTWPSGSRAVSVATRPLYSVPAVSACWSSDHWTASANLRMSQNGLTCKTQGLTRVGARTYRTRTTVTCSFRCLSSTPTRPTKGESDGKTPGPASRSDSAQKQQKPKGLQKVLPSLTPHENIYTVPNLLTFSRLAVAPFIGYAILHDAHTWALGLFTYAGVSDLLDGWIARRWKLQTVVGSVVDPMADKILMTILTVCLATKGALPVWLAIIILGRDVALGIAAIYYRWISLPPPKTFTRYWDFSLPSAEVRPTTISKYNTFLQLGLMGAMMVAPVLSADVGGAMTALQYLVATTTVWSGLSYVFSKDAVRILSEKKGQKSKKDS